MPFRAVWNDSGKELEAPIARGKLCKAITYSRIASFMSLYGFGEKIDCGALWGLFSGP